MRQDFSTFAPRMRMILTYVLMVLAIFPAHAAALTAADDGGDACFHPQKPVQLTHSALPCRWRPLRKAWTGRQSS